jgi:TonB family protein
MGIEGTVVVNALISETGDVIRTSILRKSSQGTAYGLETASEACVRQWKFKPAVKDGVNVKTWKAVALQFKK